MVHNHGASPSPSEVKRYSNRVVSEVFDWSGNTLVVEDTSRLPLADQSCDTTTFVACLNHTPYRLYVFGSIALHGDIPNTGTLNK